MSVGRNTDGDQNLLNREERSYQWIQWHLAAACLILSVPLLSCCRRFLDCENSENDVGVGSTFQKYGSHESRARLDLLKWQARERRA